MMRIHRLHLSLTAAFLLATATASAEQTYPLDIQPQPLTRALQVFAHQSGLQVIYYAKIAEGRMAKGVSGTLSIKEALSQLLADTDLTFESVDEETVAIRAVKRTSSLQQILQESAAQNIRLAETAGPDPRAQTESAAGGKDASSGSEIVVTGTHIRGVTSSASPVQVYTREDIDHAGLGTVQAFIEKLPQNFSSASENTIYTVVGNTAAGNADNATGVNLRGFGNDATLALVNGRRISPGGLNGSIADVSMIPLGALERVEMVTDGASAIYGSDAVGGVVNFILRRDYDGAETRARYGSASQGGTHESQIGQGYGKTWDSGSLVLNYEYFERSPLSAGARDYTRHLPQPLMLLPEQKRHSIFANTRQTVAGDLELFADGVFSDRKMHSDVSGVGLVQQNFDDTKGLSVATGARKPLSESTQLELSLAYASSRNHNDSLYNSDPSTSDYDTDIASFDAKIDGTLPGLQAGAISYAAGGQLRKESFGSGSFNPGTSSGTTFDADRKVSAAYVELRIPLMAAVAGRDRLALNIADRYERYDDFGTTNNPQLGLIWRATQFIKLRGTIGTSFKAPLLSQLDDIPYSLVVLPTNDPQGAGSCAPFFNGADTCTNTLVVFGGNTALGPEKARTWTAGLDLEPGLIEGLKMNATYYSIHFKNRIANPAAAGFPNFLDVLRSESILGPTVVQRDPELARVQEFAAMTNFINPFNLDLATIGVILDYRENNLSEVRSSGVDVSALYRMPLSAGQLEAGVEGTYILKFDNQFTPAAAPLDARNKPYSPVDLRLRAHLGYDHGAFSAGAYVNYVDSYEDHRGLVVTPISSWTTVDVNAEYDFPAGGMLRHVSLGMGVSNLADKEPPYVANGTGFGVDFDGTNANALGRFWFVRASKQW